MSGTNNLDRDLATYFSLRDEAESKLTEAQTHLGNLRARLEQERSAQEMRSLNTLMAKGSELKPEDLDDQNIGTTAVDPILYHVAMAHKRPRPVTLETHRAFATQILEHTGELIVWSWGESCWVGLLSSGPLQAAQGQLYLPTSHYLLWHAPFTADYCYSKAEKKERGKTLRCYCPFDDEDKLKSSPRFYIGDDAIREWITSSSRDEAEKYRMVEEAAAEFGYDAFWCTLAPWVVQAIRANYPTVRI